MCGSFKPPTLPLLRSSQMDQSWLGAIHMMVVTARPCMANWAQSNFRLRVQHLRRSCLMDRWLRGATHRKVVMLLWSKISWGMSSNSKSQNVAHSQRSWPMARWLHGVIQTMVVIPRPWTISSERCKRCTHVRIESIPAGCRLGTTYSLLSKAHVNKYANIHVNKWVLLYM